MSVSIAYPGRDGAHSAAAAATLFPHAEHVPLPSFSAVTEAAITSERAAELHGLTVISGNVGDHPEARTRFVALAPYTRLDRERERWRTAFSFVTDHQPGALHSALESFAQHGVDLVQLVSRPIPHEPWQYRFDAVLSGHPLDPVIGVSLSELRQRTKQLAVFGSYPADG